jgi:mutator protein MutT
MQQVTAALIEKDGRILLARRRASKHLGSKWEFPGGKIDPGESPAACLKRELAEELSIEAAIGEFIAVTRFRQGEIELEIRLYRVEHVAGEFILHEHEEIRWVAPEEVESFDLVDSDRTLYRRYREARGGTLSLDSGGGGI